MEGGKLSDSLADRQESRRLRCSSESLVFDTFGFGMESEPLSLDRTTAGTPTEVSRRHFDHDFSETSYQAACSTPPDSSPPRSRLECPPSPSPLRTCQGPLRATTAKRPRSRLFGDTEGELQDETRRLSLFSGDDDDVLIPFRSNGKRARNCLFGDHDTDEVPAESGSSLCFGSLLTHDENSENTNLPVPTLRSSRDDSFVTPQHKPIRPKTTSLSVTHSYKRPGYLMPGHMSGQALFSSSQQDPPGNLVLTKSVLMPKSPCRPTQRPNPKSPSRPTLPRFTQNPWSPRPPVRSSPKEETNDQADLNTLQNTSLYNLLFKEIDYLGEGSFGTVYQCRHIVDGWDYAVKISKKPLRGSKDFQGRLQEVFALAALPGHPNLVRYYNAWVYDGLLYIQMEFCDGGTLLGNEKEFRQHELAEIMLQLASGLDCLHSHKMVHKDVKPENIYISITEEVSLLFAFCFFQLFSLLLKPSPLLLGQETLQNRRLWSHQREEEWH